MCNLYLHKMEQRSSYRTCRNIFYCFYHIYSSVAAEKDEALHKIKTELFLDC